MSRPVARACHLSPVVFGEAVHQCHYVIREEKVLCSSELQLETGHDAFGLGKTGTAREPKHSQELYQLLVDGAVK